VRAHWQSTAEPLRTAVGGIGRLEPGSRDGGEEGRG
jgi:hypothetical protein